MNDKDTFALWIAEAMYRAKGDDFGAAALADLSIKVNTTAELDHELSERSATRRPGDFGLEFLAAVLPALLVEFGRILWDAYAKSLAEQGAQALATATIDKVKELARHTWSRSSGVISLADAESKLRGAAARVGLSATQTNELVASFHSAEMAHEVAAR